MILIDSRTGSAEIAPLLSASHLLCRLEYADFAWTGNGPHGPVNVGVERKALLDLLNSITSGRLSGHQMVGLTRDYDWVYLIVEGVWRPDPQSGILQRSVGKKWVDASQGQRRFMARDIYNFLNTLAVMCGVIVIRTGIPLDTARWLDATYGWWQKRWKSHKSHLQFQQPVTHAQLRKPSLSVRIASQLDGIGWDRARALGKRFSVLGLVSASEEELCEVDGIGKGLAKSIVKQIRGG